MTESFLTVPETGELIDLTSATSDALAIVFTEIADSEKELRAARQAIGDEITRRLDHEGRRSVTTEIGWKVETTAPTEKVWDLDRLRSDLAELVEQGVISDAKAKRCVKFEPKPVWKEIKTLLSDPRCSRLNHAFTEEPAPRYARVTRP